MAARTMAARATVASSPVMGSPRMRTGTPVDRTSAGREMTTPSWTRTISTSLVFLPRGGVRRIMGGFVKGSATPATPLLTTTRADLFSTTTPRQHRAARSRSLSKTLPSKRQPPPSKRRPPPSKRQPLSSKRQPPPSQRHPRSLRASSSWHRHSRTHRLRGWRAAVTRRTHRLRTRRAAAPSPFFQGILALQQRVLLCCRSPCWCPTPGARSA